MPPSYAAPPFYWHFSEINITFTPWLCFSPLYEVGFELQILIMLKIYCCLCLYPFPAFVCHSSYLTFFLFLCFLAFCNSLLSRHILFFLATSIWLIGEVVAVIIIFSRRSTNSSDI